MEQVSCLHDRPRSLAQFALRIWKLQVDLLGRQGLVHRGLRRIQIDVTCYGPFREVRPCATLRPDSLRVVAVNLCRARSLAFALLFLRYPVNFQDHRVFRCQRRFGSCVEALFEGLDFISDVRTLWLICKVTERRHVSRLDLGH